MFLLVQQNKKNQQQVGEQIICKTFICAFYACALVLSLIPCSPKPVDGVLMKQLH